MAILVDADGFHARADRARLAAVFVHDHFGFLSRAVEVRVNEVHLRLHRGKVLLCPTL